MLTFYVPPGIGDFSAMYAKLCNVDREIVIRSSNDSPNRLSPFLDLLPKIKNGGYAAHTAMLPVQSTIPPGTDVMSLEDGDYFLSINSFMEEGGKLADWIPGETTYHYEMKNAEHVVEAHKFLDTLPKGPKIGVYCSAYGNSRHWGFWDWSMWRTFLQGVIDILPKNAQYLLIGAEYDLAISEVLHAWMQSNEIQSHLLLGQFHIGATIEMIRQMDYLFAFPSGLGFLADVVNTPNMMWFPINLELMMGTFLDPVNYESGKSFHTFFSSPEIAFERFKSVGLKHLEEAWRLSSKSQNT